MITEQLKKLIDKLYQFKFEIFITCQMAILFGSLIIPPSIFNIISPIIIYFSIIAGSVFIVDKERTKTWITIVIFLFIAAILVSSESKTPERFVFIYLKIFIQLLFHSLVTFKMIQIVWQTKFVNKNMFLGLISGFVSLGLVGFFICLCIESLAPLSFSGLDRVDSTAYSIEETLMYFSYITLLTIGYGDIIPLTHLAQKATILIGLVGQFYLVIITAIVVGKFINQTDAKN